MPENNRLLRSHLDNKDEMVSEEFAFAVEKALSEGDDEIIIDAINACPEDRRDDFIARVDMISSMVDIGTKDFNTICCIPISIFADKNLPSSISKETAEKLVQAFRDNGTFSKDGKITISTRLHRLDTLFDIPYSFLHDSVPGIILGDGILPGESPDETIPGTGDFLAIKTLALLALVEENFSEPEEESEEAFIDSMEEISAVISEDLGLGEVGYAITYVPETFHEGLSCAFAIHSGTSIGVGLSEAARKENIDPNGIRALVSLHDLDTHMQFRVGVVSRLTGEFIEGLSIDVIARTEDEFSLAGESISEAVRKQSGELVYVPGVMSGLFDKEGRPFYFSDSKTLQSTKGGETVDFGKIAEHGGQAVH